MTDTDDLLATDVYDAVLYDGMGLGDATDLARRVREALVEAEARGRRQGLEDARANAVGAVCPECRRPVWDALAPRAKP